MIDPNQHIQFAASVLSATYNKQQRLVKKILGPTPEAIWLQHADQYTSPAMRGKLLNIL